MQLFNARLADLVDALRVRYQNLRLVSVNTYELFNKILASPKSYGFTEAKIDVLSDFLLFDKRFDGPGRNYVFWDPIHPTTKSHALIADWFYAALAEPPRLALQPGDKSLVLWLTNLEANRTYRVQRSTDLFDWADFNAFTANSASEQFAIPTNDASRAFFRVR